MKEGKLSGLSDKLLQFTGLIHCTQHRVLKLGLEKKQTVLELSVGRINLHACLCLQKRLGFLGGSFFFLLLFILFMIFQISYEW